MEVILLEKIEKLGNIGAIVKVRDGYGRNFLIPRHKALRATEENKQKFEIQRAIVEQENLEKKAEAEANAEKINQLMVTLIRQAGEDNRLYGSVTSKDISNAISDASGVKIHYSSIILNSKFKELGIYEVDVVLHAEVKAKILLNIARNQQEADVAKEGMAFEPAAPQPHHI